MPALRPPAARLLTVSALAAAPFLLPPPVEAYLMMLRQGAETAEIPNENDFLGWALATGDFDGDGFDDLAMGAPSENEDIFPGREHGAVVVSYGSARGITLNGAQFRTVGAINETIVHYGIALAAGNFNNDPYDDLAVGVPDIESFPGGLTSSGEVWVYLGGPTGLSSVANFVLDRTTAGESHAALDRFGAAVAAGDFDLDGRDDLAVGAPGADGGSGAVYVFSGDGAGIDTTGAVGLRPVAMGSTPEPGGEFGAALAAGHLFGGLEDDLAIGAPGRDVAGVSDAGQVYLAPGSPGGITPLNSFFFDQSSLGTVVDENAEFGFSLAIGHLWDDADSPNQLAVGTPGDVDCPGPSCTFDVGRVYLVHDFVPPFNAGSWVLLEQSDSGLLSDDEFGDRFGHSVAIDDWDDDGFDDIAAGAPGENVENVPVNGITTTGAGKVFLWLGGDAFFGSMDATTFHGRTLNDTLETSAQVGWALAFGHFDDSGRANLAIGAPTKDFRNYRTGDVTGSAGQVYVLAPWRQPQSRPHRASVAFDCNGQIVYAQRPVQAVTPASVTKALTALIAVEAIQSGEMDSNAVVTIPDWVANNVSGSQAGYTAGQQVRFVDLIKLALAVSAGDACYAIGDTLTGGNHTWNGLDSTIIAFNNRMNTRASELGMTGSNFNNPSGRPLELHFSTALDWVRFAEAAMKNELFRYFAGTRVWADIPNWPTTANGWLADFQDNFWSAGDGIKPGGNGLSQRTGLWSAVDPVLGRYEAAAFGIPSTTYGAPFEDSRNGTGRDLVQLALAECDPGFMLPPDPDPDPDPTPWGRFPGIPGGPPPEPPHCFLIPLPGAPGEDASIELYPEGSPSEAIDFEVTVCRSSEIVLGPTESAVLSFGPVDSHRGFRLYNVLESVADLRLTTSTPAASQDVILPGEDEHAIAPASGLGRLYTLTIENLSTASGVRLQVDELGYVISGMTAVGNPFTATLSRDPNQSEEVLKVCVDGRDPDDSHAAILLIRPTSAQVVAVEDPPGAGVRPGLRLRAPLPNPFTNGVALAYELAQASPVWITIHDVGGRAVRRLERGTQREAGLHVVRWNGRDDAGRRLPAGVYFQEVRTGVHRASARLVLLP